MAKRRFKEQGKKVSSKKKTKTQKLNINALQAIKQGKTLGSSSEEEGASRFGRLDRIAQSNKDKEKDDVELDEMGDEVNKMKEQIEKRIKRAQKAKLNYAKHKESQI